MLLLAALAHAASLSTSFSSDAGGWTGGELGGGLLTVYDGVATLAPGPMTRFTLTARVRLARGTALSVQAGDATLTATYEEGGGLSLGAQVAPLPLAEQEWVTDEGSVALGGAPSLARLTEGWALARELGGELVAATSSDGLTFEDTTTFGLGGTAPDLAFDGFELLAYYACAGSICLASSEDGATFTEEGVVLAAADTDAASIGAPSVTTLADGTWFLTFVDTDTGAIGAATSGNGRDWSWAGALTTAGGRFGALDVAGFSGGSAGAWAAADGVWVTPGDAAGTLAASTADRRALGAGFAAWTAGTPDAPELVLDQQVWTLWVEAEGEIGRAVGTPTPGDWVGLVLDWDGATMTATWGDGPVLTTALDAASAVTLTATGVAEMDEAQLVYTLVAGDTGDTGDSGGDTSGADDTGGDSAAVDSGDTAAPPAFNAAQLGGEPGGWGCATAPGRAWSFLLAGPALLLLTRSRR